MAVTMEDMNEIKKELDDRYVLQADCSDIQKGVDKRFANDDTRIKLGLQEFATIKKLLWVIASTSIISIVNSFMNIILK